MSEFYKEKSGTYHFSESSERKFDEFYGNGWKVFKQKNKFFVRIFPVNLPVKVKLLKSIKKIFVE